MAHTIFILGTDPQQCRELREILQDRTSDTIVTAHNEDHVPGIKKSDAVVITSEEKNTGILYRRLLNKIEEQDHRAGLLSDLIGLFSCGLEVEDLLERVVSRSTAILGDASFIVLLGDSGELKVEAAFSKDKDRLVKMLINAVNLAPLEPGNKLFSHVLEKRKPFVVRHLDKANLYGGTRAFVEKYSFGSLVAVPIQTKDAVLGAFVWMACRPDAFTAGGITTASAVADFTAAALENARLFAELQRSAITDPLTGIYNTRFFNEVLGREAARADRYLTPLSLMMIDVDSFKLVNDTFGHVVGNKVLSQIARILERAGRNTDFVFRCGGDEFAVVLPATNLDGAMHAAEKILHRVESSGILPALGYSGPVTVSIGVSEYHRGSHFETLIAEADQALYDCKKSSRNCARAYRPSSDVNRE